MIFFARLFSRHIKKAIPGIKTVVKNRPGAGHIIAANLVYQAKPNGLTVGSFSTGLVYAQIQKRKGIRFDLAKMSWVGKAQSDWRVASLAVNSKDYKTIHDVFNSKRPIKFSASGIGAGSYNDAFLFSTAYNIPRRIIVGYSGSSAALGMLRGETDVLMGGMSSGLSYVRAGQLKIALQFGKVLPGIPDARDIAKTPAQKALSTMMENQGKLSRITTGPPKVVPDPPGGAPRRLQESRDLQTADRRSQACQARSRSLDRRGRAQGHRCNPQPAAGNHEHAGRAFQAEGGNGQAFRARQQDQARRAADHHYRGRQGTHRQGVGLAYKSHGQRQEGQAQGGQGWHDLHLYLAACQFGGKAGGLQGLIPTRFGRSTRRAPPLGPCGDCRRG